MLSSTSLLHGNCIFNRNNTVATQQGMKTYWLCKSYRITMCRARCITHQGRVISATGVHNHGPHMKSDEEGGGPSGSGDGGEGGSGNAGGESGGDSAHGEGSTAGDGTAGGSNSAGSNSSGTNNSNTTNNGAVAPLRMPPPGSSAATLAQQQQQQPQQQHQHPHLQSPNDTSNADHGMHSNATSPHAPSSGGHHSHHPHQQHHGDHHHGAAHHSHHAAHHAHQSAATTPSPGPATSNNTLALQNMIQSVLSPNNLLHQGHLPMLNPLHLQHHGHGHHHGHGAAAAHLPSSSLQITPIITNVQSMRSPQSPHHHLGTGGGHHGGHGHHLQSTALNHHQSQVSAMEKKFQL